MDGLDGDKTDRERDGRFAKGNRGGPGRPRLPIESEYLRVLAEACPPDAWLEICERAVDQARQGDPKAREWLARYVVGSPEPRALLEAAAREKIGVDELENRVNELRQAAEQRAKASRQAAIWDVEL